MPIYTEEALISLCNAALERERKVPCDDEDGAKRLHWRLVRMRNKFPQFANLRFFNDGAVVRVVLPLGAVPTIEDNVL